MKTKTRWSWARWLDALERADLPEAAKSLGRDIPPVMKRTRHALMPWELPSAPGYGEFAPLKIAGLLRLIPASGCFVPIIDPLPAACSIRTTPAMRHILRLLLRGGLLDFTEPASRYATPGWRMRRGWNGPTVKIDPRAAHRLLRLGLLEWNGCGNWPVFDHRCYRVAMRRLHGVKGFRSVSMRWIREQLEKS